jgi:uncharacterized protein
MIIYHIVTESDLRAALRSDRYAPSSLDDCGFIHCALRSSVLAVANDYFAGISERVLVLEIDTARLVSEVRYEAAAPIAGGGSSHLALGTEFPHVYGPIDTKAITGVGALGVADDGYHWPLEIGPLSASFETWR